MSNCFGHPADGAADKKTGMLCTELYAAFRFLLSGDTAQYAGGAFFFSHFFNTKCYVKLV